jgi:hypothetical protein
VRAVIVAALLLTAVPAAAQDLDHDGLSDLLEQALLERFTPTLLISRHECAGLPAAFQPGSSDPRAIARDATLYGQAFPVVTEDGRPRIELHFFHLWDRDCGRAGHDLDAEHVSAIVSAPHADAPAREWIADAWYAAAHEGSVCDASSGAAARVIDAETTGARVFVSRGKHASYLDRGQCKWGCGGDDCSGDVAVRASAIVNVGEFDAPLNGAVWTHSPRWPMAEKLASDFDPALRAKLESPRTSHVIPLMQRWRAPQAPVLAGDTALDGLATAVESTAGALKTATRTVRSFLRRRR